MSKYNLVREGFLNKTPVSCDSILEGLRKAQIFTIRKTKTGMFILEEECDNYFSIDINKSQLKDLANELLELSES